MTGYGRSELDITDAAAVGATLRRSKPAVVVNCAAWTAVDEADIELTNRELTVAILEACGADWDMVTMVEDRKGHDRRYSLDDSVLRAIGYAPRIPFAAGLPSTVQWCMKTVTGGNRSSAPTTLSVKLA